MQATDLPFNVAIEAPFWELFQPPFAIGSEAWQAAQVHQLPICPLSCASAVACYLPAFGASCSGSLSQMAM